MAQKIYYFDPRTSAVVGIPNEWKLLSGDIMENPDFVAQIQDLINKSLYFSDLNGLARALDNIIGDDDELYVGGIPTAEGTWRIIRGDDYLIGSSNNLYFQRFDGNDWQTRSEITGTD